MMTDARKAEKKKWLKPAKTAKTLTAENYWKH